MMDSIYQFNDYRNFLVAVQKEQPRNGHGFHLRLAKAAECQSAYVSRVFAGQANFSLEQAVLIAENLGLTKDESQYFLLLVQLDRAGNPSLRRLLEGQIRDLQKKKTTVTGRIGKVLSVSHDVQTIYFSRWIYAALHVLASIPGGNENEWGARLQISTQQLAAALQFLIKSGLIALKNKKYLPGTTRMHLPDHSPLVRQHHFNWRMRALRAIEQDFAQDLHYTSVVSLSKADFAKLRDLLLNAIERYNETIQHSRDEEAACLTIDWFKI